MDAKTARKAAQVPTDAEAVRVVIPANPLKAATGIKFYGLLGDGTYKAPYTIANKMVFYFGEYSKDCPLPVGQRHRPTDMRKRIKLWNENLVTVLNRIALNTPLQQTAQATTGSALRRPETVETPSLINRIRTTVASHEATGNPKHLENLLEFLETRFPGIEGVPNARSIIQFFDMNVKSDDVEIDEDDENDFQQWKKKHETDISILSLKDVSPGSYLVANGARLQVSAQWGVMLSTAQVMYLREELLHRFIPFDMVKAIFRSAALRFSRAPVINT
ncbi:MAG: hypothetical protein M1835_004008 [Candelina submexicana]|nr:MAG: hypothetical protein M1835_004008 [Candelina submexicana]